MSTTAAEQRFSPTSGVATGWVGLALCAIAVVLALTSGWSLGAARFALGAALAGVVVWCYLLRPRVLLGHDRLVLRNPLSEWRLPVADVERVVVRAVMRVHTTSGASYDAVAVGRSIREMARDDRAARKGIEVQQRTDVPELVERQVLAAAERARLTHTEAGDAERRWAVPELVALAVLALALVVAFVL